MSRRRLDVTWKWLIVVDRRRNLYLLHHGFPPREKLKISNKNGIKAFNFRKTAMQSRP